MKIGVRVKVEGYVQWDLIRNGFSVAHGEGPNLVTTSGLTWIAERITSAVSGADDMQYIRAGDSDINPALDQDDIQGNLWKSQVCGNDGGDPAGEPGGTGINDGDPNTALWRAKFTYDADADSPDIIREMALCTAADDSGVCIARFLTGPEGIRGYVDGDSIVVVWALTIGG